MGGQQPYKIGPHGERLNGESLYTQEEKKAMLEEIEQKKVDIVQAILKSDTKGKIPKILLKKTED